MSSTGNSSTERWPVVFLALVIGAPVLFPVKTRASSSAYSFHVPRAPRLTLCSQNLANFGLQEEVAKRVGTRKGSSLDERELMLVERFRSTGCRVIAVQEVVGSSEEAAMAGLRRLAGALSVASGERFLPVLGGSRPGDVRCGFLVAEEGIAIERAVSYAGLLLPKLEPSRRFDRLSRGPLVLQIRWRSQRFSLINIHFKSKYGGGRDPYRLQFEMVRMQMAQQVGLLLETHFASELHHPSEWVVILGDRNSRRGSASDQILRGERALGDFTDALSTGGSCLVAKSGDAVCPESLMPRSPLFDSVLVPRFLRDTQPGSYRFRGKGEWIDEIAIHRSALAAAVAGGYSPRSRVVWDPEGASDHALVAVELFEPSGAVSSLFGKRREVRAGGDD